MKRWKFYFINNTRILPQDNKPTGTPAPNSDSHYGHIHQQNCLKKGEHGVCAVWMDDQFYAFNEKKP
jgi:hypothetical protein